MEEVWIIKDEWEFFKNKAYATLDAADEAITKFDWENQVDLTLKEVIEDGNLVYVKKLELIK